MSVSSHSLIRNVGLAFSEFTCKMAGLSASALAASHWEVNDRSKSERSRLGAQEVEGPFCVF